MNMMRLGTAAVIASGIALGGCASDAGKGALAGGAGGALIGAATGSAAKGAVVGAAAGATVGAIKNSSEKKKDANCYYNDRGERVCPK